MMKTAMSTKQDDNNGDAPHSTRHITWKGQWVNQTPPDVHATGGDSNSNEKAMTMGPKDVAALRKRKQQMEDELAHITLQLASVAATSDSVKEATTTASTCDCPAMETHHGGMVPYGSTDQDMKETSPLLNTHIVIGGYHHPEHHDWEECFSHVRSEEDLENEKIHNESEFYLKSSMFGRAIPERLMALTVTMVLEIPVLLMISGGSDSLCMLIGRRRYQLLIGFLPLTSAISGNVGLQASTLTTRAISHLHVTATSYTDWLVTEMGAALYLGSGMGLMLGSLAFWAAGMDLSFGLTIAIAQLLSILTAGCTGTLAPLLFSFIFRRDSGKWGGPLETAIQDIVGSFAMVVVSYHILLLLGTGPIEPNDVCGAS
mmetsp:Transcript_5459/g.10587  ORF Transcript_5459/g.10587 Transcript_5459/m.10587 type:complete len:373 (-) Transcript_5459:105-1223(-)